MTNDRPNLKISYRNKVNYLKLILKLFSIIVMLTVISSCKSSQEYNYKTSIKNESEMKIENFVGVYENKPIDELNNSAALWSNLCYNSTLDEKNWKEMKVRINYENEALIAELLDKGEVIDKRELTGEFLTPSFNLNVQFKFFIYLILNGVANASVKMSLTEKNDLVVNENAGVVFCFLIMPVGAAAIPEPGYERIYKRIQ